jgi:hypothetical protein
LTQLALPLVAPLQENRTCVTLLKLLPVAVTGMIHPGVGIRSLA